MNGSDLLSSCLWLAPLKSDPTSGLSELKELDKFLLENPEKPSEASRFYSGDPITVTIRGAMIVESEDPKIRRDGPYLEVHPFSSGKSNDLLIISSHQFGTDPKVDKIHFMEKSAQIGYIDDFRNRRILAIRDFKDLAESLTLVIKIYDIDKINTEFIDMAKELANSAIAAIPALYQYSIPLKLATGTIDSIAKLADNLNPHDKIINERIDFEAAEASTIHPLLQQGYYIVFRNPVTKKDAQYLKLVGDQPKVLTPEEKEFKGCSYAIIEVHKNFMLSAEEEIDEKAAKLASELSGKGQSGRAALEFLRDTMKTYNNFRKLERVKELKGKKELSASEEGRLKSLMEDPEIKEFV
jgi:hypothetical protein